MNKRFTLRQMRILYPVLTVVVILSCLASFFYARMYESRTLTLLVVVIVILFVFLNIIVWMVTSKILKRLRRSKEFELQKQSMENAILISGKMAEHEENIYKVHHDMKNHLSILYSMLEDGQDRDALDYSRKLHDFLQDEVKTC